MTSSNDNGPRTQYVGSWREALDRAEAGVTYRCADGNLITFGTRLVTPSFFSGK